MVENSSNVYSINGEVIVDVRTANQACIDELVKLLDMALSGEIKSVIAVSLCHDGATILTTAGQLSNYALLGRLEAAKIEIMKGV